MWSMVATTYQDQTPEVAKEMAWWAMEAKQNLLSILSDQMLGPPAQIQILKTGTGERDTDAWEEVIEIPMSVTDIVLKNWLVI